MLVLSYRLCLALHYMHVFYSGTSKNHQLLLRVNHAFNSLKLLVIFLYDF